jgi:pyrroloquinoline quinone (PQQ) biosynthesis protein C
MREWHEFAVELEAIVDGHPLWQNELLTRIRRGGLTEPEWGYVFRQQQRYSSQFTRFLGALIARIPNPEHRGAVVHNLIDETGESDPEAIHSNILKRLVVSRFGHAALEPADAAVSDALAAAYLRMIETSQPAAGAALLAYGCEGVVPRLYQYFVDGMRVCGFTPDEMKFFTIHIDCDDGHAGALANLMRELAPPEAATFAACRLVVMRALDERNRYYNALSDRLTAMGGLSALTDMLAKPDAQVSTPVSKTSLSADHPHLYDNEIANEGIGFHVSRLGVPCTVLDPRLLTVRPGMRTEFHSHAHESLFIVLEGTGAVRIGDEIVKVAENDVVYVPRWIGHQTINTGNTQIKVLAITDFGMTRRFEGNSETSYRRRRSA